MQPLITATDIQRRVKELADAIARDHHQGVHLVCVLKGAFVFLSDLARALECDVTIDFIALSSYGAGMTSSGQVQLLKDLDSPIDGRDVVTISLTGDGRGHRLADDHRRMVARVLRDAD